MLRHQPPPGLTSPRSHARTFILRPRAPFPTLSSSLRPEEPLSPRGAFWGPRSIPPPSPEKREEAAPGRKRRSRRRRGVDCPAAAAGEALPLVHPSPCPVHDVSATRRREKVAPQGGRGCAGVGLSPPPLSAPRLSPLSGGSRSCLGVGGPVSSIRLPLAGGGHFSYRCPLPPPLNRPSASRSRKSQFSPFGGPG